ncbi:hypothetical protein LB507_004143 [Fusarium sp. FIESC RH6]|nr:hypothetical protein LB507_004143 [Fusarium sp. FIESC RH6]
MSQCNRQKEMKHAFQVLHDNMKAQAEALERLNRDKELSKVSLHVIPNEGQRVDPPVRNKTRANASRSESKHSSRPSNKSGSSARHGKPRKKPRRDKDRNLKAAEAYEFVILDDELLIMATDTDEYKSAGGGDGTGTNRTGLIRIEREVERMSQDEWEQGMGNHLYEFQLAHASNSTNTVDDDLGNKTIPVIIEADKQSRAFIGQTTKLDQCVDDETDSMLFCVAYICITETDQTFNIKEPCDQPCRHIELQIMNPSLTEKKLPCMLEFQSMTCGVPAGEMVEIQPSSNFILECYHRCPHRKPCSHTIIEGKMRIQDCRTRRMIVENSDRLQAWSSSSEQEFDTPTESSEESDTPTGGPGSPEDDNEAAMALLEMVHRQDNDVPARIPFETLVGYLKLVERLELDVVHLVQCHIWTDAIISEVPNSFDEKMIAWAWVFWKLERDDEFKQLTAIMQQRGKYSIGEKVDQYGLILPQQVISKCMVPPSTWVRMHLTDSGAIDWKRISVLSQIRDLIQNSIEISRRNYMTARREDDPGRTTPPRIVSSSLMVGYLTLEYEMFLLDGRTWDDGNFDGVSFADASGWITSMVNLRDWMAKLASPPSTILSGLQALFSGGDAGSHESRISSGLPLNVYEDLNGLVRRLIEEEEWGVDLPDE